MSVVGVAIGGVVGGTAGAAIGGAVGSSVLGAYGAKKQAKAYEKAAKTEAEAMDRASERQMEQYYQSREDMLPWLGAGEEGLYNYMALMGLDMPYGRGQQQYHDELRGIDDEIYGLEQELKGMGVGYSDADAKRDYENAKGFYGKLGAAAFGKQRSSQEQGKIKDASKKLSDLQKRKEFLQSKITPVKGDPSQMMKMLESSPDYQFALGEGMKAKNYALNRKGLLGSGRADRERQRYAQGLASQQLQSYRNALGQLSGVGQTTGQQMGSLGAGAASAAGRFQGMGGSARASGYQAKGQGYMNMANSLQGGFGDAMGLSYMMGIGPFKK
jgi:hypothetical protein